jgi:hypothetical protein
MPKRTGKLRYFFVGDDDSLNRIYLTKYERIFDRTDPIILYAGKSLRFIETFLECDEDGNERLLHASFIRHQFDELGLWVEKEKDRTKRGAMEGVSFVGKGDYMEELHKAEHVDPFRWTPTPEMVERLKQAIRTKKKHSGGME